MKAASISKRKLKKVCACALGLVFFQQSFAQELPSWTPEERELVEKGLLIPGYDLLVEGLIDEQGEIKRSFSEFEAQPLANEYISDPEPIPDKFFDAYFAERPDEYLIDPQQLLSRQEAIETKGFLDYHTADSEIDIRLYLFDAKQIIPSEYSLVHLAQEVYGDSHLTAVVFCFLGDPSRNRLAFGGQGAEHISGLRQRRMLESSLLRAMEKSELASQVDAFVAEMSIKLYWMEQDGIASDDKEVAVTGETEIPFSFHAGKVSLQSPSFIEQVKFHQVHILLGLGSSLLTILGTGGLWMQWNRTRRHHFQVLEIPRRLGADYAAGVGAVISFHNKYGSPANQQEEGINYLTKV